MTPFGHQAQIDRLYRRTLMTIAPVKVLATDDSQSLHKTQVNVIGTPEIIDDTGVMQLYGFAGHQPVGSDATAIFTAGHRSAPIIVGTNHQKYRPRNQKAGEVMLYTDEGDSIALRRDKHVRLTGGTDITHDTPVVYITHKLVLGVDPQQPMEAGTKRYIDAGDRRAADELAALREEVASLRARVAALEGRS